MTDDTAPHEAAMIAAGLTDAQRGVLIEPYRGVLSQPFYPARTHAACRALVAKGCLTESSDRIGNPMYRYTAKGLASHALLQENDDA